MAAVGFIVVLMALAWLGWAIAQVINAIKGHHGTPFSYSKKKSNVRPEGKDSRLRHDDGCGGIHGTKSRTAAPRIDFVAVCACPACDYVDMHMIDAFTKNDVVRKCWQCNERWRQKK